MKDAAVSYKWKTVLLQISKKMYSAYYEDKHWVFNMA